MPDNCSTIPAAPRRVLLADDSRSSRRQLETWLEEWGYEVVAVADGDAAREALLGDPTLRLALVDWMMPGMDGPELCRTIRAQRPEPYVYMVLLTGRNDTEDVVAGLDSGADDYVKKPFDPHELEVRLRAGRRITDLQHELTNARERLRHEAMHDALTGIYNRGAIVQVLERELARGDRDGSSVAVVLADLDHFKAVNDEYGHEAGDGVLVETARRLKRSVRGYDAVGRLGGEEFLLVLPTCEAMTAARLAVRVLHELREAPIRTPSFQIEMTASFGTAATDQMRAATSAELIRAADMAMYRAKNTGRGRVVAAGAAEWDLVVPRHAARPA